ncbi:hypothetical protein [Thermanaeromonas sp. C210]|uniref:hypothetical protein n=1 Tax=Thermanaeromonas sp. C210 TaxID=2731925 RepID=UPI00155D5252|nr:hypothetical protein [Thermanaeromonas sp. C210]GFN22833.1 hypothetical protein TAMC210_11500 [Thermanaeromonas sp. C210]
MKNLIYGRLNTTGRVLFLLSAALLIASLFFPWWYMNLVAPQYPEGLPMTVYANKIGGRIDIINNLNHYIGMKEIQEEDFPELKYMTYGVSLLAFLAVLTALLRRNWLGLLTAGLGSAGGALGIYRLWYWLHKYGTELDPQAAMKIPPFTPPMIGTNQLANFTTYTGFGLGGYLLGIGILLMVLSLWRFRQWDEKSSSSASLPSSS